MSYNREVIAKHCATVPADVKNKWIMAFNEFDVMKNGVITAGELEQVMTQNLKMSPAPGEVAAMIAAVDHDNDNAVNYEEFEMMMVAAGRGTNGGKLGFSHVVTRFIRMTDIAGLVTEECKGFVEQFCMRHRDKFADLVSPDVTQGEQKPAWFDTYKIFCEEAELMMQNALMLWGAATMKNFDEDFLDVVGDTGMLDNFLKYTEYHAFLEKMHATAQAPLGDAHPAVYESTPRPETPCSHGGTQKRLAQLDRQLAMLDYQRNQILAERRRLVGCEVQPVTTTALKRELEMRRWKEDVGND